MITIVLPVSDIVTTTLMTFSANFSLDKLNYEVICNK